MQQHSGWNPVQGPYKIFARIQPVVFNPPKSLLPKLQEHVGEENIAERMNNFSLTINRHKLDYEPIQPGRLIHELNWFVSVHDPCFFLLVAFCREQKAVV